MAIDARIPLQRTNLTVGKTIQDFADRREAKKERERQIDRETRLDEIAAEDRTRLHKRQDVADVRASEAHETAQIKAEFDLQDDREKRRIRNTSITALKLKPFIDKGDKEGARAFLQNNKKEIGQLKGQGEDLDTADTDIALQSLDSDFEGLRQMVDNSVMIGERLGVLQKAADGGFTLAPDAIRFDASGKEIARGAPKKPDTVINLGAGSKKEQEKLADTRVSRFDEISRKALAAEEQNDSLRILGQIDVEQGFGVEGRSAFARVINAAGGDGEAIMGVDPANVQGFNSVVLKEVLNTMATQKGPQTDKDQERIAKTFPAIKNEAKANEFIKNSTMALNSRRVEMRDFYQDFLTDNDTLKGADKAWSEYKQLTPMLSDSVKDPETGLPMFFDSFIRKAKAANPQASRDQLVNAWRELADD